MKHQTDPILRHLRRILPQCWSAESSVFPDSWHKAASPDMGQCEGTAMIVEDMTGMRVVSGVVVDRHGNYRHHFWNEPRDCPGEVIDLAAAQFAYLGHFYYVEKRPDFGTPREALLRNPSAVRRYHNLKARVEAHVR